MEVTKPIEVTESSLTSSIARIDSGVDNAADYSSATTYAEGEKVIYPATTGTDLYESLQDSNTNHDPSTEISWWLPLGKVNRWRMFDKFVSGSVSTAADGIEVTVALPSVAVIALFWIIADQVVVSHLDSGGTAHYSDTYQLYDSANLPSTWYDFYFAPFVERATTLIAKLNYPTLYGESVKVEIQKTGSTVTCGKMIVGYATDIGVTQWGPQIQIMDFSKYETDSFGRMTVTQGAVTKLIQAQLWVSDLLIDAVVSKLEEIRGIVCVFDLNTKYSDIDSLRLIGVYRDSYVVLPGKHQSLLNTEIIGVI